MDPQSPLHGSSSSSEQGDSVTGNGNAPATENGNAGSENDGDNSTVTVDGKTYMVVPVSHTRSLQYQRPGYTLQPAERAERLREAEERAERRREAEARAERRREAEARAVRRREAEARAERRREAEERAERRRREADERAMRHWEAEERAYAPRPAASDGPPPASNHTHRRTHKHTHHHTHHHYRGPARSKVDSTHRRVNTWLQQQRSRQPRADTDTAVVAQQQLPVDRPTNVILQCIQYLCVLMKGWLDRLW